MKSMTLMMALALALAMTGPSFAGAGDVTKATDKAVRQGWWRVGRHRQEVLCEDVSRHWCKNSIGRSLGGRPFALGPNEHRAPNHLSASDADCPSQRWMPMASG